MKIIHALALLLIPRCLQADTTWVLSLPECAAKLERRSVESGVLLVRSDCPLSLASLTKLLETGLRELFPDHDLPIHGIALGRLMNYPEWSQSLAKTAAASASWNSKRGRPRKVGEGENQRIRQLLNGSAYPQTLKPLFARYGLTPCIAEVEKVLVFKAKDIFPTTRSKPHGIPPEARLPVDAQIWLTLKPLSSHCD